MKKNLSIILVAVLTALMTLCVFVACEKKETEPEDPGVVITFVTGFENDANPLIIEPRVSTLESPAEMPLDPWRVGYSFLGWYYDKKCTRPFSTQDGIKEDITLYAKWVEKRAEAGTSTTPPAVIEAPDGLKYSLTEDNTYNIVGYSGKAANLTLTSTYNGKAVTGIAANAFNGNSTIKKITLANSIKEIEGLAFYGCSALSELVTQSNDIYSSADGILYAAGKTEIVAVGQGRSAEVNIGGKVAKIMEYAFAGGKYTVTIGNAPISVIGEYAFALFGGKVNISAGINEIRRKAFYGSDGEIIFPEESGVTALGIGEFDGYKGKKIVLPASIKSISGSPFYDCTAEVDFSATGIKDLGEAAFAGYAGTNLVIPYFVNTLGRNCFYRCSANVTFDDRSAYSVIEEFTFNQFLGNAVLPSTVRTVKTNAFYAMRYGTVKFSVKKGELTIESGAFELCNTKNISYR